MICREQNFEDVKKFEFIKIQSVHEVLLQFEGFNKILFMGIFSYGLFYCNRKYFKFFLDELVHL